MQSIAKLINVGTNGTNPSAYRGSVRNSVLGLMYLAENHPTCRVILTFALQALREGENIGWSTFAFKWSLDNADYMGGGDGGGVLTVPGVDKTRYARVLMRCITRDAVAEWVAAPITIRSRMGHMHANFLLHHIASNRVFRFEPYGQTPTEYDGPGLDAALSRFFKTIRPDIEVISSRSRACNIQDRQERETMRHPGLEKGYCQVFAILYASVQMSELVCTKDSGRHHLCDVRRTAFEIDRYFRGHDGRITAWIRAYSNFLVTQYKSICLKDVTKSRFVDVNRADTIRHVVDTCPKQFIYTLC
jgi:hypothetical protein